MNRGDLVRIRNFYLYPGEPNFAIYLEDGTGDYSPDVSGTCDCLILWNNSVMLFYSGDLELVNETG